MSQRIKITDFMAPELDVYARLTENQLLNRAHPEEGMFIAESPKVIERAIGCGCIPVSLLMETKHAQGEAKEMIERCGDIPVYTAEFDVLTKLTGFALTRGALCAMYRPKLQEPEEICAKARRIAVLENVVNPTNVGAIFRSAAALHMDAVLLTPGCSDPLYRRAIRVSMGTVFQIPWTYLQTENGVKNPPGQAAGAAIDHLHKMGFRVAAMALSGIWLELMIRHRCGRKAGCRAWHGRGWSGRTYDCGLRLYGLYSDVAWRGFAQCSGGKCRGILAAREK